MVPFTEVFIITKLEQGHVKARCAVATTEHPKLQDGECTAYVLTVRHRPGWAYLQACIRPDGTLSNANTYLVSEAGLAELRSRAPQLADHELVLRLGDAKYGRAETLVCTFWSWAFQTDGSAAAAFADSATDV